MKFVPEKTNAKVMLLILALIVLLFEVGIFFTGQHTIVLISVSSVVAVLEIYLLYYIILIWTLNYIVTDEFLIIKSRFDLKNIKISWADISSYHRSITLLENDSLILRTKRFAFGKVYNSKTKEVNNFFITSSKKAIFIHAKSGIYAISPKDVEGFVSELEKRNISVTKETYQRNMTVIEEEGLRQSKALLKYTTIIVFLSLIPTLVLKFIGKLPEKIDTTPPFINYVKLQTQGSYIQEISTYSALILGLLILFYVFMKLLLIIEKRYYHKILYIPLILSILLLLYQVNNFLGLIY